MNKKTEKNVDNTDLVTRRARRMLHEVRYWEWRVQTYTELLESRTEFQEKVRGKVVNMLTGKLFEHGEMPETAYTRRQLKEAKRELLKAKLRAKQIPIMKLFYNIEDL